MIVYPAIDLQAGKCVRLYQGDFEQETIYDHSPAAMVQQFADNGAQWLHIVDLDGAKDPLNNQAHIILDIAQQCKLRIQTGGGIRHTSQIEELLHNGIERVIIGSKAVSAPEKVYEWLHLFGPEHIVIAVDCHIGSDEQAYVATHGWQQQSDVSVTDLLKSYLDHGLQHILCTDINRDGTMKGPNFKLYEDLVFAFPQLQIQASGGVASIEHIEQLKQIGLAGSIVGKAIYENQLDLKQVFSL